MRIKLNVALLSIAVVPLLAFVPPRPIATKARAALSSGAKCKTALYVQSLQVRSELHPILSIVSGCGERESIDLSRQNVLVVVEHASQE